MSEETRMYMLHLMWSARLFLWILGIRETPFSDFSSRMILINVEESERYVNEAGGPFQCPARQRL